jgi:hypothetical protein
MGRFGEFPERNAGCRPQIEPLAGSNTAFLSGKRLAAMLATKQNSRGKHLDAHRAAGLRNRTETSGFGTKSGTRGDGECVKCLWQKTFERSRRWLERSLRRENALRQVFGLRRASNRGSKVDHRMS